MNRHSRVYLDAYAWRRFTGARPVIMRAARTLEVYALGPDRR